MENPLYRYSPIVRRRRLELPRGERLALWIGVNVEHYVFGAPALSMAPFTAEMVPDPLNFGWRDYGVRVGLWRLAGIFEHFGVTPSILLNSEVCELYPEIIEEGRRRQWSWVAHGRNNSTLQTLMSEEEERVYIEDVVDTIERHSGSRPRGWLSPVLQSSLHTHEILASLGLDYLLDWANDDQPYDFNVQNGRLLSVPYSSEINDIPAFHFRNQSGPAFARAIIDQFDVLYEEGRDSARIMGIGLHPFLVGQPYQSKYLTRALDYIVSHDGVWITTSDEIASWYAEIQ